MPARKKKSIRKQVKKAVNRAEEASEEKKKAEIKAKPKIKAKPFKAILSGETVISKSADAFNLYNQSRFGEIIKEKVYYSLVEALYLLEKGKLSTYHNKKKLNFDLFVQEAKQREKEYFHTRYCVYSDLRNRGYIVKTALKFGADFRVYAKGVKPGEEHALWVVYPVYETSNLTWHEFAAKNRVAHSTRKKLLIAIVDEEGDVTYYEVEWKRP